MNYLTVFPPCLLLIVAVRWPNELVNFPESKQAELANFLFSEDGLWLSSYRYNMGGDGGNDTEEVNTVGRVVESFLLRNGTYDWNRDKAGVKFLELAQQYSVPYITFFINAAPSAIASNGAACGKRSMMGGRRSLELTID